MRIAGISALFLLATGCGVGDDGGMMMPDPNGRQCNATLTTTGTFAADTANPAPTGWATCWPVGTWTFTAKVGTTDCSPAPTPAAQYVMKGVVQPDQNGDPMAVMQFQGDTTRVIAKYSDGGSGLCEGELDIYSADGKTVWLLKPELNTDGATLSGDGEYGVFATDQYPL
ncbi:MAG: hypothetical protein JO257_19705 [Deltaproteobacteria bacterium]|nr:hypothetical protein [Deltaproteobacteria bacterium]